MAVVIQKSNSILGFDAVPFIPSSAGEGSPGREYLANDSVAVAATDSVNSVYRLVRLPWNAKIKRVDLFSSVGGTTVQADLDLAFSDSTIDGSNPIAQSLNGGIVQLTGNVDNKLFGAAQSLVSTLAAGPLTKTFAGSFTLAFQNTPLWQVLVNLGLAAAFTQFFVSPGSANAMEPGGLVDLVLKLTTATGTVAGNVGAEVRYVMGS
jgi:hypothetical protein